MEQTADGTDLRAYLTLLARQWRVIAGVTLLTMVAAMAVTLLQTPEYEGVVELAIEPVRSGGDAALEDLILGTNIVETERRVITSRPVTTRAIELLGSTVPPSELTETITVTTITNTRVVRIVARDTDARTAADTANAFATAYLDYRRDRAIDEVSAARSNLDQRAQELRDQIDQLEDQLGPVASRPGASLTPGQSAIAAERDVLTQQLALVNAQYASIDVGSDAIRGGGEVLVPAEVPEAPVSPRPVRSGLLSLVLGLMLGIGLAFLRDHFDDAIRGEDDITRVGADRPIIGRITHWDSPMADQRLITLVDSHHPISEEFQALSANVRFTLLTRRDDAGRSSTYRQQSVLVTSANPGEGKSSVAGNLAVAASAAGKRVILVGADLRQPTIATRFGLSGMLGLSDLLLDSSGVANQARVEQHLVQVGNKRLRLLPAGTIPPNPTELIASPQMAWLHGSLTRMADLVIYDTPPLLPVADTLELSTMVDATIVVARPERSSRRELQHAVERLTGVGASIAGFVANDLEGSKRAAYGYSYGYTPKEYRPRIEGDDEPAVPGSQFPAVSRRHRTGGFDDTAATGPDTPPQEPPPTRAAAEPPDAEPPDAEPADDVQADPDPGAADGPSAPTGEVEPDVATTEQAGEAPAEEQAPATDVGSGVREALEVEWDKELFGGR